jgi:hypothetical protein
MTDRNGQEIAIGDRVAFVSIGGKPVLGWARAISKRWGPEQVRVDDGEQHTDDGPFRHSAWLKSADVEVVK